MTRLPMMAGTCSMESEHYGPFFFIRLGEFRIREKAQLPSGVGRKEGRKDPRDFSAQDSSLAATIWAKIKEGNTRKLSIHPHIHLYLLLPSFLLFQELTFQHMFSEVIFQQRKYNAPYLSSKVKDPKAQHFLDLFFIFTRTYPICEPLSTSTAFMEIISSSQFLTHKHEILNNLE
jgi:hypothetical protein